MRTLLAIASTLFVCAAAYGAASEKPVPQKPFRVLSAEFGLVGPFSFSKGVDFRRSTKVPLRVGQGYGWIIRLETSSDKIRWREEFTAPVAPESWGGSETNPRVRISEDRTAAVYEREEPLEGGVIFHFWQVVAGDPTGRHVIRVFVEGVLVSTFEFNVE